MNNEEDVVNQANVIVLKLSKAMPDFIKIDSGKNFQAAKRARKIILEIQNQDLPELKKKIKEKRVPREYLKTKNK